AAGRTGGDGGPGRGRWRGLREGGRLHETDQRGHEARTTSGHGGHGDPPAGGGGGKGGPHIPPPHAGAQDRAPEYRGPGLAHVSLGSSVTRGAADRAGAAAVRTNRLVRYARG